MTDTVFVMPYPGLILPDVPRRGAHIPRALADSWVANGLVVPVPGSVTVSDHRVSPRRKR